MKTRLFPIAVLLLLLLSVICSACVSDDPNKTEGSGTQEESDLGSGSQTESDTTGDETNETGSGDDTTESESTDDTEGNSSLDDLYPNEPDDGHTKRY